MKLVFLPLTSFLDREHSNLPFHNFGVWESHRPNIKIIMPVWRKVMSIYTASYTVCSLEDFKLKLEWPLSIRANFRVVCEVLIQPVEQPPSVQAGYATTNDTDFYSPV